MEHPAHPHPVRAVCGCGSAAVCAGVLEKCHLPECSDTPVRAWRGLFPGAVRDRRFSGGMVQLVFASGSGAELHCAAPEHRPAEKTAKKG